MKNNKKELVFNNKEEWLKLRELFVGGSEIGAILGLSKYSTPYQVWESKTGRAAEFVENNAILRGRFLEDGIAKYFEYESGHVIIQGSDRERTFIHKDYPRFGGSVDRRIYLNGDKKEKAILEIKTTKFDFAAEDIPLSYYIQPNNYCGLFGYKKFILVWFCMMNDNLSWQEFDFNEELFKESMNAVNEFWDTYVIPDIPPPAISDEDIKRLFPNHMEGKSILADEDALKVYSNAITAKRECSIVNKTYNELKTQIKLILGDAEYLLSPMEDVLATFRTGARGRTLNIKEL